MVVYTGQMPHGQSHQTTLAQIAADQMGVPFEEVSGSWSATPTWSPGLHGRQPGGHHGRRAPRSTSLAQLRSRVLDVAAELLEASPDDLEIVEGRVSVRGVPGQRHQARGGGHRSGAGRLPDSVDPTLEVTITYDGGQGGWSGGTHCAEVEVDPETGLVQIVRYVVAEDCGELINPAIVEGQVRGGVAQGIGAVLLERSAYDENGQFLSGSFMDYLLPTATEVPPHRDRASRNGPARRRRELPRCRAKAA